MNRNEKLTRPGGIPLRAMMLLLIASLIMLATGGCKTSVKEISADRYVRTLKAGVPFTPPVDGKFVPQARWLEMMDAYVGE